MGVYQCRDLVRCEKRGWRMERASQKSKCINYASVQRSNPDMRMKNWSFLELNNKQNMFTLFKAKVFGI